MRLATALAGSLLSVGAFAEAAPALDPSPPVYEISLREAKVAMPDGVRLAADLYLPTGGPVGARFPVLLEYLPYRKNEARARNYALYSYFVKRGFAVARVDIRGTGNSEGRLIAYEYTDQEQTDGEAVIDWLSKQPFSTGKVGMFGISWGGFNSIHMAMRNPPALKAIVAVDATDDLYQDDVHFMDGIIHVDSWEMGQDLANLLPGAPDFKIDEKYFADRFDTPPWMLTYKRQQRDGPFWKRTALKERYESIRIPTFVIGGLYDGYRDSVPRMLEHLKAPDQGDPGPLAPRLSQHRLPAAPDGVASRSGALVRPVAEGTRYGGERRAALRGLHPRLASAGAGAGGSPGRVAIRGGLADKARSGAGASPATEPHPGGGRVGGRHPSARLRSHDRHRSRRSGHVVRRRGSGPETHRCL